MAADDHLGDQFAEVARGRRKSVNHPGKTGVDAQIGTLHNFTDSQNRPSLIVHNLMTNVGLRQSAAPLARIGRALLEHADREGRWIHTSYMASNPKLGEFYKKRGGFEEGGEGAFGMGDIALVRRPRTWTRTYTQGKLFD